MPDNVRVDDGPLRELDADLRNVSAETVPVVNRVMKRGANNVKNTMRADARGHPHFPHFPRSITYDKLRRKNIAYEIGPDKRKTQGALGNILYFGTSNNAPVLDLEHGIREEAPRLERHLANAAAGLLGL